MRYVVIILLLVLCPNFCGAQQPAPAPAPPQKTVNPAITPPLETQKIETPTTAQPAQTAQTDPGFMEPAQVKDLLHKLWQAEFRLNDLLSEVHPERWKISETTRTSFSQSLEALRKGLASEAEWRSQFDKRPDSMYLGYETYATVGALLPRLDGLARSMSQFENPSLGAQYSQAEDQLFDLQQKLQPYLAFLLRNQDQVLYATQTNLASCQNELGTALRGRAGLAKPIKNTFVEYHGVRRSHHVRGKERGKDSPPPK
jgi:hypothetical protein